MPRWSLRQLVNSLHAGLRGPTRRVARVPRCAALPEQLEARTLLSAAGRRIDGHDQVAAHVAAEPRRNLNHQDIGGNWTLQSTGQFPGQGFARLLFGGYNNQTMHVEMTIAGLNPFEYVERFKRSAPTTLSAKTSKVALPGFPKPVRLDVTLEFVSGNPSTLTGTIKLPNGETLVTLTGTHGNPGSAPPELAATAARSYEQPDPKQAKGVFLLLHVQGRWTANLTGDGFGTTAELMISQAGNKVTVAVVVDTQTVFTITDHFTKRSPSTLSAKTGKFVLFNLPHYECFRMTLTFPNATIQPQSFTGSFEGHHVGPKTMVGTKVSDF